MSTEPEIARSAPTKKHAYHNTIFLNKKTGEYSIRVRGGNGRWRWLSLKTKNKLEAIRRLEETSVSRVLRAADDEAFKQQVVEVLMSGQRITLERVHEEWIADAEMRLERNSLCHHRAMGRMFLDLFPSRTSINTPTAMQVSEWISLGTSLTMRRRRLGIMRDYFQFAFDQGYRKDNIARRLAFRSDDLTFDQIERKIRPDITAEDFAALMACPQITGFWRHAIQLGWWLGLRRVDVCAMQWGSICAVPGKLVVWQAKTRRRVEFDLADPIVGEGALNAVFADMRAAATDPVYCFPEMRALYRERHQYVSEQFAECMKAAGLDHRKGFHAFRKGAAMRWQAAGRSISEIGELLGHEGTENTGVYLERENGNP